MPTLAIMQQGARLDVDGEMFKVMRAGSVIRRDRIGGFDRVLVFGAVELSPAAVAVALRRGIDVAFLTRRGRYRGRLVGPAAKNVDLRLQQFDRSREPEFTLEVSKAFVRGKIANQRRLLLRSQREQRRDDLAAAIAGMREMFEAADSASSLEELRGLEGRAAALYFGILGKTIRNPAFSFARRTRRPPRDAANAVLSFGYTILTSTMESLVLRAGLDPMVGFFHQPEFGRSSLTLDLVEELRAVLVDALMLRLFNRRQLSREDFETAIDDDPFLSSLDDLDTNGGGREDLPTAGGVWLSETGRRVFLRTWARRLHESVYYEPRSQVLSFEEILRQRVYHMARTVAGSEAYTPFMPR